MGAVATHAINPALYPSIPYNAGEGLRRRHPGRLDAQCPGGESRDAGRTSVAEFVALAKSQPGKLNFGSGSTGSAGHLAGELFKSMAGVDMAHIPYKGAAAAMQDLIGGRVDLMFDNLASSLAQVKGGRVRALAVTTAKRTPLAPELPTIAESGLPGFDISTWFGDLRAGRHAAARDRSPSRRVRRGARRAGRAREDDQPRRRARGQHARRNSPPT